MPYKADINVNGVIPRTGGGGGREFVNHKLKEGDNVYRILPPFGTNHGGIPFAEVSLHWFIDSQGKKRPLSCSYPTERYCPTCEEANKVYKEKEALIEEFKDRDTKKINWKSIPVEVKAKHKELSEKFNFLRAQRGFYYNALDTSGTIGVLRLPKTAAAKLGELIRKAVTVHGFDPLSLERGTAFNIIQKKTGPSVMEVEYEVEFVLKSVQSANGVEFKMELGPVPKNILDNYEKLAYDVHAMYPRRTAQELKRAMLGDAKLWVELDEQKQTKREKATPETVTPPATEASAQMEIPSVSEPPKAQPVVAAPAPIVAVSPAPATPAGDDEEIEKLKAELGL